MASSPSYMTNSPTDVLFKGTQPASYTPNRSRAPSSRAYTTGKDSKGNWYIYNKNVTPMRGGMLYYGNNTNTFNSLKAQLNGLGGKEIWEGFQNTASGGGGNNTVGTSDIGFSGGGGGGGAPKALDTAQLNSLQALLNSLTTIKSNALRVAGTRRDTRRNEKNSEKDAQTQKYDTGLQTTGQDFANTIGQSDVNTRNTLDNLLSSLAVMGMGGREGLIRQIMEQANQANRNANMKQAQAKQALTGSYNDYLAGYNNDMKNINDTYSNDVANANKDYAQNRQNALYRMADVYGDADDSANRNRLMKEGQGLSSVIANSTFLKPTYTGVKRQMATPDLSQYTQNVSRYSGSLQGAGTPVSAPTGLGVSASTPTPSVMAVNNADEFGIKKKPAGQLGYGV